MPDAELVQPRYGASSLGEVVPSALAALGGGGFANALGLPPAASYVVLLVDGLGWNLLLRAGDEAPYLSSLVATGRAITAGVPSTTATSLTSIGTGLPPGKHGVVGFTSRIPGTDRLLDALHWDKQVDPRAWQPHATAFERAARQGVAVSVVSKRIFAASGLTQAGQRGAAYLGADYAGEQISVTADAARRPGSLTYVYEGDLDATGHRRGCRSTAWRHQLGMIDSFSSRLRAALPPQTALVVVADHGMVDVVDDDRVDVDLEPSLEADLTLLGGEARFRHLYCAASVVDAVSARWRDRLGDGAVVLTREQAIGAGWFGAVDSAVRPRLGDVLVACVGDLAVVSTRRFPREAKLLGLHGSLTADEMLVPLLVDPGA